MNLPKQLILNTNENLNYRIYPIEVLEIIKDQLNTPSQKYRVGTLGYNETNVINIKNIAFRFDNAVIEGNSLYADIEVMDTPKGLELKKLIETDSVVFRPSGEATFTIKPRATPYFIPSPTDVQNAAVIKDDYKFYSLSAILKEEDAIVI